MTLNHRYTFRPLTESDLPLIQRWLDAPHVMRWWGDPQMALSEIRQAIAEPSTEPFLIFIDGEPAGYIHSYDIHAERGHPYRDQPDGTLGIDLTIGEADLVGRGHGPHIVETFVTRLFASGARRIVIDPAPDNRRAVRAYEKAGFQPIEERVVPRFGPALIMARDCPQPTEAA